MQRFHNQRPPGAPICLEHNGHHHKVQSKVIALNLPELWRRERRILISYGNLPLSDLAPQLNSGGEKALNLLFEYLSEVGGRDRVSAALTNGLEALFAGSHSRHNNGFLATQDTFASLGKLLHPRVFGCGPKLFKQMEGFFLKHNEELFAAHDGLFYIFVLDEISLNGKCDMAPALACLVRSLETGGLLMPDHRRLESLSPKSHRILVSLMAQSNAKARRQHRSALELHDMRLNRPRLERRPHSHQGCFPSSPRPNPNVLYLDDVRDICLRTLETLDRQPVPPGLGFPHEPYGYEEDLMLDVPYMYGGGGSFLDPYDSQLMLEPDICHDLEDDLGFPYRDPPWRPRHGRRSQRQLTIH
ncbi:hypothetical protein G7Y79_00038g074350 [Physcia stellaris]|nr:hypothetical protein G7Y79_00038g074350 [Physcia stellaris]